jgi:glycosyltransferase involved in cell wall biosynthesis
MIDKLFPAGIELQLLVLMRHLDRSRVAPYLCLLDGTDEQTRALEPNDCPVIRLGVQHLCRPASLWAALRLARFLRRERIDVLHPLFHDSFYFGVPVAKAARVPCIAGFRVDLGYWMTPRDRSVGRFLSRWVDGAVANCEACREALIADLGVPAESVAIIPNGVDLSRFADRGRSQLSRSESGIAPLPPDALPDLPSESATAPLPPAAATRRVGIVANLRPVKNLALFIRAALRLAPSHPDVQFEIAGEGELRCELQSLIDTLGLRDRVALLGTVSEIPEFLQSLDVAVLCSVSEGSPNAIMEYMAAGLPTVATAVGGNSELVEHEVTGLLVPSNSEEHLAIAIDRLLCDRTLAARFGATARQRAFAEYGVEVQARRYAEFYRGLLARKLSSRAPVTGE